MSHSPLKSYLNSPAISLATRIRLSEWAQTGTVLDPPSRDLVVRVLDKVRAVHPGGLVHGLTRALGGSEASSVIAGSVCELYYAGCSVTDDLQDGDTDSYLGDLPLALRINAQVQILSLVAVRLADLSHLIDGDTMRDLAIGAYRTLSVMLTGQRLELVREPWNIQSYEAVARLSAGEQFSWYFSVSAATARQHAEPWASLGCAVGMLLQMIADEESQDPRWLDLPDPQRAELWTSTLNALHISSSKTPLPFVHQHVQGLVRRCPAEFRRS